MMSLGALLLITAGSCGAGSVVMAALGMYKRVPAREVAMWCFVIGLGALGWLTFFIGIVGGLTRANLTLLCVVSLFGLRWYRWPSPLIKLFAANTDRSPAIVVLVAFLVALSIGDLAEAVAPPTDGDSLSYHFALPKLFLRSGAIEFVPRAIDGAMPLLVQMTYMIALGIGGEKAMMLWAMVSGWAAGGFLYLLSRRFLSAPWALAIAAIFLSTPAVLYGAGSGQVEVRNAMFVLAAAFAVATAVRAGDASCAALAGLAAGFFAGGKLFGLFYVAICGLVLVGFRVPIRALLAFGAAAALAGSQWYAWNWWHSGDPVFPLLYEVLGSKQTLYWNDALQRAFVADIKNETGVPSSIAWFFMYPVVATFAGLPIFESGRTGFGVFVALVFPMAAAGIWRFRDRLRMSDLLVVSSIAILFYTIWFFSGSPQRIRHLLPIYPLVLLAVSVPAIRWALSKGAGGVLTAAVASTLVIQLGIQSVFSAAFIRHLLSSESRDEYLERMVSLYTPVPWINANLGAEDRLLFNFRILDYVIEVPSLHLHPTKQAVVEIHAEAKDIPTFIAQLRQQRISHALIWEVTPEQDSGRYFQLFDSLIDAGCAAAVYHFEATMLPSRTLQIRPPGALAGSVLRLHLDDCAQGRRSSSVDNSISLGSAGTAFHRNGSAGPVQ